MTTNTATRSPSFTERTILESLRDGGERSASDPINLLCVLGIGSGGEWLETCRQLIRNKHISTYDEGETSLSRYYVTDKGKKLLLRQPQPA